MINHCSKLQMLCKTDFTICAPEGVCSVYQHEGASQTFMKCLETDPLRRAIRVISYAHECIIALMPKNTATSERNYTLLYLDKHCYKIIKRSHAISLLTLASLMVVKTFLCACKTVISALWSWYCISSQIVYRDQGIMGVKTHLR